ncbi:response regulator [Aestuariibacter salexigens]|uniref:response regulator n=1 Tax=Aestuariibacter salexigens TaxID=226010 RepID=UPI00041C043F|nr:response regulator transcription factor [Aestuariibacter salexigens]
MIVRVMLVDDQTLVREGIKSLLSLSEKIQVVAEAGDGEQAISQLVENDIDVMLLDIRMPRMNGIQTLQALSEQGITVPVIMLTTFDDHELILQALQKGAKGYLLKDVSLETLVEGIETVYKGNTLIQPAITERVVQSLKGVSSEFESFSEPEKLSEKELEILRLMASGCSNREIAEAMFKSEGTIKNQVSSVLAKLGVRDRTRAVLKAIDLGLL